MSLAQRVRDFRYSKGWGPDELASRAEISRTALYQIESGKTELPRAGTLRRIAIALDVPMEDLLGSSEAELMSPVVGRQAAAPGSRARFGWSTAEDGPVQVHGRSSFAGMSPSTSDDPRLEHRVARKAPDARLPRRPTPAKASSCQNSTSFFIPLSANASRTSWTIFIVYSLRSGTTDDRSADAGRQPNGLKRSVHPRPWTHD